MFRFKCLSLSLEVDDGLAKVGALEHVDQALFCVLKPFNDMFLNPATP
jgi:hypothetical protein